VFLLALSEGKYQDGVDLIADRLDPNVVFKLLINYTKRLFLLSKYDTAEKVQLLKTSLNLKDIDTQGDPMDHYKKKQFDADEEQEDSHQVINPKIMRENKAIGAKTKLYTYGDKATGDMGAETCYNLWLCAPKV